jgi:uncharacterized protein DUF2188
MGTGSTLLRVVEHPDDGWDIREPGNTRPLAHRTDLDEAIFKAGTMMERGGAIRIVNREGFLLETRTVPAPGNNPWWYLAPGPLFWVLGGIFTLQGVLGVLVRRDAGVLFWTSILMGLVGVAYVAMLLFSRRRDRRLARSERTSPTDGAPSNTSQQPGHSRVTSTGR